VTVVERFPALRATGAQVDLRGQGIDAVRRMGLLDVVRNSLVDEAGVAFVNARGKARATIMANTSGQGRQTLTSEYRVPPEYGRNGPRSRSPGVDSGVRKTIV
jgi:hypothetical protein